MDGIICPIMSTMTVTYQKPLAALNTFGIDATAQAYIPVRSAKDLQAFCGDATLSGMPWMVLGGGSNVLFTRDFKGVILHMQNKGMQVTGEDAAHYLVQAAAGETWHAFVLWTIAQGMGGLENLSLIPGTVGAAPIQNIGAYGVEVKDVLHSLTIFDMTSRQTRVMSNEECRFGYRDSIFKQALHGRAIVLDVTFALPKAWQANTRYGDVAKAIASAGIAQPTPKDVSDAIIAIRRAKLPDPAEIGNAGSFFKNPVVARSTYDALLQQHEDIVAYVQMDGSVKLAAGWLIDQTGWKGRVLGNAAVYDKQALVLVNRGGATGAEIAALAKAIQYDVQEKFHVFLEPEPLFI